jgi:hypothetical protein
LIKKKYIFFLFLVYIDKMHCNNLAGIYLFHSTHLLFVEGDIDKHSHSDKDKVKILIIEIHAKQKPNAHYCM